MKSLIISVVVVLIGFMIWKTTALQNRNSMNHQISLDFIKAINQKDIEKMASMMTEDHLFIDALSHQVRGKEEMKKSWTEFFRLFPDYQINITMIYEGANSVALFGYVGESPKTGISWKIPASFEAVIANGKISIWAVIADTKTPLDILNQRQANLEKVTSIGGIFFKSKK